MYVQIVERNPGTLTELNLLSGTPPVPQHYSWSVNIICETVVTIKKNTKRGKQETLIANAKIVTFIKSMKILLNIKCDGHLQSKK